MDRRTAYAQLPLHRQIAPRAPHPPICVIDLETRKPDAPTGNATGNDDSTRDSPLYGPICPGGICLYGNAATPDAPKPERFDTLAALLDRLISDFSGFTILAHNGGDYEFNYLVGTLRALVGTTDRGCTYAVACIHQGERIIGYDLTETTTHILVRGKRRGQTVVKTRRWRFVDTYPLFNMSLAEVAQAFCPDLPKLKREHYHHEWSADNPDDVAYLVRDCAIVFVAYRALSARLYNIFQARPGRTAGATALHAFAATIPAGHCYYRSHPDVDAFVRRAYHGGLVLPGTTTRPIDDVILLDMSGAYGYQMQHHTFPVGAPTHTYGYVPGATGVYACRVHSPTHLFFGVIAEEKGEGYPLGDFETVCTSVEMEYAETLGYTFEVREGYYWTREEPVFQPFMERVQALELEPGMKPLAKLLRNSLYGKFCARTTIEQIHLLSPNAEQPLGSYALLNPATGDEIEGLYSMPGTLDAPYLIPIWGVLITAYQRVYVAQRAMTLYAYGAPTVYVDTDSLCTTRAAVLDAMAHEPLDFLADTPYYGGWKVEQEAATLLVAAPKAYALLDERGRVVRSRAKGLPLKQITERHALSATDFSQQTATRYTYISAHHTRERLLRPELPIRRTEARALSRMIHAHGWAYHPASGAIRPPIRLSV